MAMSSQDGRRRLVRLSTMLRDRLYQHRNQRRGKIVAHAFDEHKLRALYMRRRVLAALGGDERIVRAVDHQSWDGDPLQQFDPTAVGHHRQKLARNAAEIIRTVVPS